MKLLNMLTMKNLRLNRKRTTVTVIGIMLSVALISTVMHMALSFYTMILDYEVNYKGNYHVAYYQVPVEDIPDFYNNRAIETCSITQNIGYALLPESKNDYKPYAYVKAYTKTAFENLCMRLKEGRYPENENEILITTHLKTNGRVDYQVGDTITLNIGTRVRDGEELTQEYAYMLNSGEEIVNTTTRTYTIVGITERPASSVEGYEAPGYTMMTYMDEEAAEGAVDIFCLYNKEGMKDIYRVTAGILNVDPDAFDLICRANGGLSSEAENLSEEEWQALWEKIENIRYDYWTNDYLIMLETNPFGQDGEMASLGIMAMIACLIIVVTSVFCIKNSFDISITEKTRQYGMLRSVGATTGQIRKNVLYEAFLLGLVGIPLGLLLGAIATAILVQVCNYYLMDAIVMLTEGDRFRFVWSWWGTGISILLGVITIYLSAIRSAVRAARVSPIESIRGNGDIKLRAKKIRCPKWIVKLFGVGGEISYKNLKRNRKKYRTTIISITVSVLTFVALSYILQEMMNTAKADLKYSDYNLAVGFTLSNPTDYPEALKVTELDHIKRYSVIRGVEFYPEDLRYSTEYYDFEQAMTVEEENYSEYAHSIGLRVVGDKEYRAYLDRLGLIYDDMWDKLIVIDTTTRQNYTDINGDRLDFQGRVYSCEKGDMIHGYFTETSLKPFSSQEDRQFPYQFEVGYVTEEIPFGMKPYNYSGEHAIISDALFDSIVEDTSWCDILMDSDDADGLQDEIEEMITGLDYDMNNVAENVRMMKNLVTLIGIFLYGFIIVVTLIGVTTVFNTVTTNMELRKKEFAMLRSVGMTDREFSRMIRLETVFMGTKALVIGIPVGLLISFIMYVILEMKDQVPFRLPYPAILLSTFCVFLLIAGIMRYSMSKIEKQNTIETIRNENV